MYLALHSRSKTGRTSSFMRGRRLSATVVGSVVVLLATACGSGSTEATSSSSGASSADLKEFSDQVDTYLKGSSVVPSGEVVAAAKDKTVWVISCGEAVLSCSVISAGVLSGAKAIGWETKLFDGQLNPTTETSGIRQAVAAGADGIITIAQDCQAILGGLTAAAEANIPLANVLGEDCPAGSPVTFKGAVTFGADGISGNERNALFGEIKASYLIDKFQGRAKVISLNNTEFASTKVIAEGFSTQMEKCSECEVYDLPVAAADFGPKLAAQTQQALLKYPDADALDLPTDGIALAGPLDGVRAAGKAGKVFVMGGEGLPPNLELIASGGGQDAAVATDVEWEGWAAIDNLNSLFAGKPMRTSGIGLQIIDKDHNLPADGVFRDPVDYQSAYMTLWGLDG